MRVVVPVSGSDPKTRLAAVLDADERLSFTEAMLGDVVETLAAAGYTPDVVATGPIDCPVPVTVDDRGLDPLINDLLDDSDGDLAVVMADLPLLTAEAVQRLFAPDTDVMLAPGRGGGTNAFVARHPEFRVDYHGASIRDHRRIAREIGADLAEIDSRRLATDIDEPDDLAEVLLHGDGRAADWLADAGFEVVVEDGRVGVTRN
ncbi:2-phospho-L-lactate guanylyltransferase [Haloarcula montana]|uniref:2-phospho-L-lactate guanylyltransferase n=1 Tax=Haloarcula montana TaxID=3111776 RepID=UPI002D76F0A7|nr:2-phospho-L-lactate guanylyltransferase [Haloarcula sp. GH36]